MSAARRRGVRPGAPSKVPSASAFGAAYFGREGSFSHQVAATRLGRGWEYLACPTSQHVTEALLEGRATVGIVPIENSVSGIISDTIDALVSPDFLHSGYRIAEQWHVPITLSLIGNAPLEKVRTVYSHPFPLAYLKKWLDQTLPDAERVETVSTSEGAYFASQREGSAAIASAKAAPVYKLRVLKAKLGDPRNYQTRFYFLTRQPLPEPRRSSKPPVWQTALAFSLPNRPGSLVSALEIFARHGLNMTRIMSRPLAKRTGVFHPDQYLFWIDLESDPESAQFGRALEELAARTTHLDVLGTYATRRLEIAST